MSRTFTLQNTKKLLRLNSLHFPGGMEFADRFAGRLKFMVERKMLHRKWLGVLAGLAVFGMMESANAVLLTFDDIPGGSVQNSYGNMPTYKGFNFSFTLDWIDVVDSPAWPFGAHSGDFSILNNNSGVGVVTDALGADFTFDGLWAKRWNTLPESGGPDTMFGLLEGYNDGNLVWSVNTGLNGSYEFYGAQSGAIDELHLGFGNHFLVDDISLNAALAVTEPAPLALLSFGLAGLGFATRRQRRSTDDKAA